jgi:NAD(P)-dependent dehydrogenase (short-subunit alcohol dehydrogenase family)
MSRPLTGWIAVVTGAARGIGRAAAVALSGAGADVAGIDIAAAVSPILDFEPATAEDLAETGRLAAAAGGRWMPHVADQRKIAEIRAVAEAVEQEWGGVDVVLANAGIQAFKPLLEMSDPDWHDQIEVNLNGTANVLRVFAPLLVRRGGGLIIVTVATPLAKRAAPAMAGLVVGLILGSLLGHRRRAVIVIAPPPQRTFLPARTAL